MAHFAKLDAFGTVLAVEVVSDFFDGKELEYSAYANGTYRQCSYNSTIRKNYPGIGFNYDRERDAFIAPKPYPSWSLNETTCQWEPPTPQPTSGGPHWWNEETGTWDS